jgi:hypothetical protein
MAAYEESKKAFYDAVYKALNKAFQDRFSGCNKEWYNITIWFEEVVNKLQYEVEDFYVLWETAARTGGMEDGQEKYDKEWSYIECVFESWVDYMKFVNTEFIVYSEGDSVKFNYQIPEIQYPSGV